MKIIAYIDRILWGTRMASLTSPTLWGPHSHVDDTEATPFRDGDALRPDADTSP
jgi:hypothetical protein